MAFKNHLGLEDLDGQLSNGQLPDTIVKNIVVGDINSTHVEIIDNQLSIWRPDNDGNLAKTVSLGGPDRDRLYLVDPATGDITAGMDDDGNVIGQQGSFNSILVGGSPVGDGSRDDLLWQFPRGIVGGGYSRRTDSGSTTGTGIMHVAQSRHTVYPYRRYKFCLTMSVQNTADGNVGGLLFITTDGSDPTLYGTQLFADYARAYAGSRTHLELSGHFYVPGTHGQEVTLRASAAIRSLGGGTAKLNVDGGYNPLFMWVEDLGPNSGVSGDMWNDGMEVNTGGGQPVPPSTLKKTYTAAWSRNWRDSSVVSAEIRAGYGTGKHRSAIGFPNVASDFAGATITKMVLTMNATHWYYYSGGDAVLGCHGTASLPGSYPANSGSYTYSWDTKTGKRAITLPVGWYPGFASGSNRGITLGYQASNSNTYYCRINGVGMSQPPTLYVEGVV